MSASTAPTATAPDPNSLLMQLATGYMPAACLYEAARLEIADALDDSSKPVADLARAAGINEDALYRLLRALGGVGIFAEPAPRTFANTPASHLLRKGNPQSIRPMILWIANPFHLRVFAEMGHSVKTGGTALYKHSGLEAFDYFHQDEEMGQVFNAAMTNLSSMFLPTVLEAYDFSGLGTLTDVGGGHGYFLSAILQKTPGLRGVVFDLPHVANGARTMIAAAGVGNRCEIQTGSFFEAVPASDSYVLKSIIHDWDDERAIAILRNCAKGLRAPGGKVLLVELLVSAGNSADMAKWIDLEMLAMAGGRERTEAEFAALFAAAGLRLSRVVHTQCPYNVIEAVQA
jgi:hypothetical protein